MSMTYHDMLDCAERELRLRRKVYPTLISRGRMTAQKAQREIEAMEHIAITMRALAEQERLL